MKLSLFNIFCLGSLFLPLLIIVVCFVLRLKSKKKDKKCPSCGTMNKYQKNCDNCKTKLKYPFRMFLLIIMVLTIILFFGISIFTCLDIYKHNATQENARNENVEQLKVIAQYINIRESKSITSNIIGKVKYGEIYTILSNDPESGYNWYEIKTKTGIHGFIAGYSNGSNYVELLSSNSTTKEEATEDVIINNNEVSKPEENKNTTTRKTTTKYNNINKTEEKPKITTTTTKKTTTISKTTKAESNKKVIDATKKYSCSFYYELDSVNKVCTKESYTSDSSIRSLICPSGYQPDTGKNCKAIIKENISATEKMACSDGTNPDYINGQYYCRSGQLYVSKVCPSGYRLISSSLSGITIYMCEWATRGYTKGYYTCANAYTLASNDLCFKVITKEPEIEYSCPSGYTLKENKCYQN